MPASEAAIAPDELEQLFSAFEGRAIALAVSGGIDSMVLMHLVARWLALPAGQAWAAAVGCRSATPMQPTRRSIGLPRRRPASLTSPEWLVPLPTGHVRRPIVVFTVDHGLRAEFADEARWVKAAAERLGFPHQTLIWRHESAEDGGLASPGAVARRSPRPVESGVQEKARTARYDLMADAIEAETWALYEAGVSGADPLGPGAEKRTIVTAHHRDDQVETFLMRLKRGSGIDGLAAIRPLETMLRRPTADRPYPSAIDLCRPLLDIPKRRLAAMARATAIAWRQDPSNANEHFERTRLRGQMAGLVAAGFSPEALHTSIRRLQRARAVVEAAPRGLLTGAGPLSSAVTFHGGLFASIDTTAVGFFAGPRGVPASARDELLLRLLRHAIAAMGGTHAAASLEQLEALTERCVRWLHAARERGNRNLSAVIEGRSTHDVFLRPPGWTLAGCRIDVAPTGQNGERDRIRVWRELGRQPLPELWLKPGDGAWWDDRFALSLCDRAGGPVCVGALGRADWAGLKRRVPALACWRGVPTGAAATLPALRRDGVLVAVPFFDALPAGAPPDLGQRLGREWDASGLAGGKICASRFAPVVAG